MNWEMIQGILRHVLTAGGGILASKGVIGASDVELITGSVVTLLGIVWSIVAKRRAA